MGKGMEKAICIVVFAVVAACARQSHAGEGRMDRASSVTTKVASFGAGCFWGVEAEYRKLKGVKSTAVGYMGGTKQKPTYEEVCTDKTGHAEVVQIEYDPREVKYERLVEIFWSMHDPTMLNRQGPDVGSQYRSVIFYHTAEQQRLAIASKVKEQASGRHLRPIVTEIVPAGTFWRAEEYHQQFLEKRGMASCHSSLKR